MGMVTCKQCGDAFDLNDVKAPLPKVAFVIMRNEVPVAVYIGGGWPAYHLRLVLRARDITDWLHRDHTLDDYQISWRIEKVNLYDPQSVEELKVKV